MVKKEDKKGITKSKKKNMVIDNQRKINYLIRFEKNKKGGSLKEIFNWIK